MCLHAPYPVAQKLVVIPEYDALNKPDGQLMRYKLHLLKRLVVCKEAQTPIQASVFASAIHASPYAGKVRIPEAESLWTSQMLISMYFTPA
jgi:hypothetical protein